MLAIIPTTSTALVDCLQWDIKNIKVDKESDYYILSIQNRWNTDVYFENYEEASVSDWCYRLYAWNECELKIKRLERINVISDWAINDKIALFSN